MRFTKNDMLKIKLFAFLFLIFTELGTSAHDYFVGTTSIKWVSEKGQIQLVSKLFIEDMETIIQNELNKDFVLQPDTDQVQIDQFIATYFASHFTIHIDNSSTEINYLGREYQEDLLVIYAEVMDVFSVKKLEVKNTLLMDTFETQQNIIHITTPTNKKSFLLHQKNTNLTYTLAD